MVKIYNSRGLPPAAASKSTTMQKIELISNLNESSDEQE